MALVAIVYHSGYGHTARVADHVRIGAGGVEGVTVRLMTAEAPDWTALDAADAIIFGAPTYMGSVSAPFKQFMDQTSRQWLQQCLDDTHHRRQAQAFAQRQANHDPDEALSQTVSRILQALA